MKKGIGYNVDVMRQTCMLSGYPIKIDKFTTLFNCTMVDRVTDSMAVQYGFPVSILRKSISGRHRPVRVADGPMTARCRFT